MSGKTEYLHYFTKSILAAKPLHETQKKKNFVLETTINEKHLQ
jgi:hypothetical protein